MERIINIFKKKTNKKKPGWKCEQGKRKRQAMVKDKKKGAGSEERDKSIQEEQRCQNMQ